MYGVASQQFSLETFLIVQVFSLLPDTDQLQSKLSQLMYSGPTKILKVAYVVMQFALSIFIAQWITSNSPVTFLKGQVILQILLFLVFFIILELNDNLLKRRVAEGMGLCLMLIGIYQARYDLLCTGSIMLTYTVAGHRSFVSHSLASLVLIVIMLKSTHSQFVISAFIGYGSHLLGDHIFEDKECPLYFPIGILMGSYRSKFIKRDSVLIIINMICAYIVWC